jgi:hypothetical protein
VSLKLVLTDNPYKQVRGKGRVQLGALDKIKHTFN